MQTQEVSIDDIDISSQNTRKDLNAGTEDAGLQDLANSIRERGLLSPIIVMKVPGGRYELIAGQRRYLACKMLGRDMIPALVKDTMEPVDATIISLIENVHRADMSPMDKARAYQDLYAEYGTYAKVAKETGVSSSTVSKYSHLMKLAPSLQDSMFTADGPAGIGTMSSLAKTFNPGDQEQVLDMIKGFKQGIQSEIIKRSEGDLGNIEDLARQAREGAFDLRHCEEGLCFDMSDELKEQVRNLLAEPVGLNTTTSSHTFLDPSGQ